MYGKLRMSFISLVLFLCSTQCFGQFYSARTNILGLVTGNLNAEFGMTLNKKFSLHLPVQYNPFIYSKSNNTKFQNLTVLPGVRYWLRGAWVLVCPSGGPIRWLPVGTLNGSLALPRFGPTMTSLSARPADISLTMRGKCT